MTLLCAGGQQSFGVAVSGCETFVDECGQVVHAGTSAAALADEKVGDEHKDGRQSSENHGLHVLVSVRDLKMRYELLISSSVLTIHSSNSIRTLSM